MDLTRDDCLTFPLCKQLLTFHGNIFPVMSLSEIMQPSLTSKESATQLTLDCKKLANVDTFGHASTSKALARSRLSQSLLHTGFGLLLKRSATSPTHESREGYCSLQRTPWASYSTLCNYIEHYSVENGAAIPDFLGRKA